MRYRNKWPQYAKQINTMSIIPSRRSEFEQFARYAIAHKNIYLEIEQGSNVPWPATAVTHKRESDAQDKQGNPLFTSYLGNGQSLSRVTTIEPPGRGPFSDHDGHSAFYWGALDAYHIDGLDKVVPPWPIEKILFWEETFNGQGYHNMGIPSPYIWGGTSIQVRGKYVRDRVFDANEWDTQLGVAGMLWMLGHLDTSIDFTRES